MYVCICNAIKESDLRDMARKSRGSAEELYAKLGHVPNCCQCLDEADEIVREARAVRKKPVCAFSESLGALALRHAEAS